MSNENQHILKVDWRYRTVTFLAKDFHSPFTGVLHKEGTPVKVMNFIKQGGRRLSIGDPSAPALFLSQSHKSYGQALQYRSLIQESSYSPDDDQSGIVYDYLELIMGSIVFAHSAIEAFANEEIPESFVYETQKASKVHVAYQKDSIERLVSLDEKLATILPKAKGKSSPKGTKVWEDYTNLRRLRDRITHLKSRDRERSRVGNLYPDSLWTKLLQLNQPNYPQIATCRDSVLCR